MPLRALRSTTAHEIRWASGWVTEREVDPHAAVLVEVAPAVVPVGEQAVVVVDGAERVHHAPFAEVCDGLALGRGDVGRALERLHRPEVAVLRRDVEVAEHGQLIRGVGGRGQPVAQTVEPQQLAVVELGADLAAVGHVDADHADSAARGRQHPRVALVRVGELAEAARDVVDTDARQDGDAVPLALTVVHRVVAEGRERELREALVGELGLLQAQDVGLGVPEPLLDARQAGLQRVDVPGGDPHRVLSISWAARARHRRGAGVAPTTAPRPRRRSRRRRRGRWSGRRRLHRSRSRRRRPRAR